MLAPPWVATPPEGYGGIELVVSQLTDELVRRGHDVHLFAAPGSRSAAVVRVLLDKLYAEEMGRALHEVDHVVRAFDAIAGEAAVSRPFDVIHDHSGFTALALADQIGVPMVHTVHGDFTEDVQRFYAYHGSKAACVAISLAQRRVAPPSLDFSAVVPNPITIGDWPFQPDKDDFLLWIGRVDEEKGPHLAIAAARAAGRQLVLAGPVQPGHERFFATVVEPLIDGTDIRYVGEVSGEEKQRLFAQASALLMPIQWNEPFGMVMIEAMACGTPVIAFRAGAAPEVVEDGVTGFLVDDVDGMAAAIARVGGLDPRACRERVATHYNVPTVAAAYEQVYSAAIHRGAGGDRRTVRAWNYER
ncbi:MAG: hypothetical protein QOG49_87 [Frankiaceae bacterium]|nr:hypothetical protein [Frankiaceae bacterium]